jgi:hypothetical protein
VVLPTFRGFIGNRKCKVVEVRQSYQHKTESREQALRMNRLISSHDYLAFMKSPSP